MDEYSVLSVKSQKPVSPILWKDPTKVDQAKLKPLENSPPECDLKGAMKCEWRILVNDP